jgi:D-tyrosyl-tRNA(Tyr) deacylase
MIILAILFNRSICPTRLPTPNYTTQAKTNANRHTAITSNITGKTSTIIKHMRVVLQRVSAAKVVVEGQTIGEIKTGLLLLVGIEAEDGAEDIQWLSRKLLSLRIFSDAAGKMNRSVQDVAGGILVISQFTLFANVKKGTRPSFVDAAPPAVAVPLYEQFVAQLETGLGRPVATGKFGADMKVSLTNDGPVTILLDSKNRG